ncbi:MAG TPA: hypothetical protein VHI13_07645 [Candidatus Kapabacteria bacterium]|nr:hypothetical protein [Candidatus Kapabacteria bacterium]
MKRIQDANGEEDVALAPSSPSMPVAAQVPERAPSQSVHPPIDEIFHASADGAPENFIIFASLIS